MNRAVIVCGAKIKDYEFVSSFFSEGDFFIYCDSGLIHEDRFLSKVDTKAGLIIGDFDSYNRPERDTEIIELPVMKDDTDSVYAIKEAISRGYKDILIVGAIGDRFDHSLVNAYALMLINDLGASGKIVDDYSEMTLIDNRRAVDCIEALVAAIIAKVFVPHSFIQSLWINSIIIAVFTLIIPFFNDWLYERISLD